MKPGNLCAFAFLICQTTAMHLVAEGGCPSSSGILGNLINKTLESMRQDLVNLHIKGRDFETGSQEFGNCNGNIREVTLVGLDKFYVKTLHTVAFDVKNLTIVGNFIGKGFYSINGNVTFPLGKKDIQLFGDGEFWAKFTNFTISVKMKIRFEDGKKILRDLGIFVGFERIKVYFKNLMGGGDLEKAFNQIINDVTVPVFNYYKETVLDSVKSEVEKIINNILSKI